MDLLSPNAPTPLQEISDKLIEEAGIKLFIKRDDLIHPTVSGNKWRKLKYSILKAKSENETTILTFGGAYSNHLYATAAAGNALGFQTIGIVRGEELAEKESATLKFCREKDMQLHFVSRQEYKLRHSEEYVRQLAEQFDFPFIIPEGGTSDLALKGVAEMVEEVRGQLEFDPDYFAVAAGTGGTAAGIRAANADVLAFSALKGGGFLENEIDELLTNYENKGKLKLVTDYHFGGYAKWNAELMYFIESFKGNYGIQLEQVYTGKMFFGLFELIRNGYFAKGSVIVAVHTGGLQGLLIRS